MGKYLQIRVAARTFDAEEVRSTWTKLHGLAFPPLRVLDTDEEGVLELIDALSDHLAFGDWSQDLKDALEEPVSRAAHLKRELMARLADWDPKAADKLTYKIEDALDEAEAKAPEK